MTEKTTNTLIACLLVALAIGLRLAPHPANFAPVAATAIFGGAILPRRLAISVPLAAMVISDALIGFHSLIALTWGCYVLTALASSKWLRHGNIGRGFFLTAGSSTGFFLVTNFGVWLTSGMYAHSLAGLNRCFEMALPFFRNTISSDLIYTSALFGIYALATKSSKYLTSQVFSKAV